MLDPRSVLPKLIRYARHKSHTRARPSPRGRVLVPAPVNHSGTSIGEGEHCTQDGSPSGELRRSPTFQALR